jgi:hypothetical protein
MSLSSAPSAYQTCFVDAVSTPFVDAQFRQFFPVVVSRLFCIEASSRHSQDASLQPNWPGERTSGRVKYLLELISIVLS